jgi:hypothetical protein
MANIVSSLVDVPFFREIVDALDVEQRGFPPTGFDDPTSPPDAPPRESLEVRTLVFFPPGA